MLTMPKPGNFITSAPDDSQEWSVSRHADMVEATTILGQRLERYRNVAMQKANIKKLENGTWYASIPGFDGVWANEVSPRDCMNALDEVLFEWLLLKIKDKDKDIPVVGGIDLNQL